jgi:hypothetical protein
MTIWECPFCFGEDGKHVGRCDLAHFTGTQPPVTPTVHMNGTGWKDLYEECAAASHAISDAMSALQKAAPNGRDYYVQAAGAIGTAIDQHWDRLKRLRAVKAELDYILMAISEQEPTKGRTA